MTEPELIHVLSCFQAAAEYDIVNDHSGPLAAAMARSIAPVAFCHTVHSALDGPVGGVYAGLQALDPALQLIAISRTQRAPRPDVSFLAHCPNAVDLDEYALRAGKEDYLLFLGRMSPDKGAHRAIAAAQRVGLPLRLAGKLREPDEIAYFETHVEPQLSRDVVYLGEVSHAEKVELLAGARATLFASDWHEPFGLVMAESMACGTPVIALRRGAAVEVVEDGVGGFLVDDVDGMVDALGRVERIDPVAARASVERRFAPERMVDAYLAAYESLLRPTAGRRVRAGVG